MDLRLKKGIPKWNSLESWSEKWNRNLPKKRNIHQIFFYFISHYLSNNNFFKINFLMKIYLKYHKKFPKKVVILNCYKKLQIHFYKLQLKKNVLFFCTVLRSILIVLLIIILALVHYVNHGSREPWKSVNQGKVWTIKKKNLNRWTRIMWTRIMWTRIMWTGIMWTKNCWFTIKN